MPTTDNRSIFRAFFFTSSGHLDISWLLTALLTFTGISGFIVELVRVGHAGWLAWGFISTAFLSVLIASVPIAKARLLADGKNITELFHDPGKDADVG